MTKKYAFDVPDYVPKSQRAAWAKSRQQVLEYADSAKGRMEQIRQRIARGEMKIESQPYTVPGDKFDQ